MTEAFSDQTARIVATPPHLIDPSGTMAVYWTDPPGAVLQLQRATRGTTTMAEWLVGPVLDQLFARYPDVTDLGVVLDMRQMVGRSATARSLLIQAAEKAIGRIARVVLLPSIHMGTAYIKVIEATALLLRLSGYEVHIEDDLDVALSKHGIRIPSLSGVHSIHRE
jgi:hypothetical protein